MNEAAPVRFELLQSPQRGDGTCVGIFKWLGTAPRTGAVVRKRESRATIARFQQQCHEAAGEAGPGSGAAALVVRTNGSRASVSRAQLPSLASSIAAGTSRGIQVLQFRNVLPPGPIALVESLLTARGLAFRISSAREEFAGVVRDGLEAAIRSVADHFEAVHGRRLLRATFEFVVAPEPVLLEIRSLELAQPGGEMELSLRQAATQAAPLDRLPTIPGRRASNSLDDTLATMHLDSGTPAGQAAATPPDFAASPRRAFEATAVRSGRLGSLPSVPSGQTRAQAMSTAAGSAAWGADPGTESKSGAEKARVLLKTIDSLSAQVAMLDQAGHDQKHTIATGPMLGLDAAGGLEVLRTEVAGLQERVIVAEQQRRDAQLARAQADAEVARARQQQTEDTAAARPGTNLAARVLRLEDELAIERQLLASTRLLWEEERVSVAAERSKWAETETRLRIGDGARFAGSSASGPPAVPADATSRTQCKSELAETKSQLAAKVEESTTLREQLAAADTQLTQARSALAAARTEAAREHAEAVASRSAAEAMKLEVAALQSVLRGMAASVQGRAASRADEAAAQPHELPDDKADRALWNSVIDAKHTRFEREAAVLREQLEQEVRRSSLAQRDLDAMAARLDDTNRALRQATTDSEARVEEAARRAASDERRRCEAECSQLVSQERDGFVDMLKDADAQLHEARRSATAAVRQATSDGQASLLTERERLTTLRAALANARDAADAAPSAKPAPISLVRSGDEDEMASAERARNARLLGHVLRIDSLLVKRETALAQALADKADADAKAAAALAAAGRAAASAWAASEARAQRAEKEAGALVQASDKRVDRAAAEGVRAAAAASRLAEQARTALMESESKRELAEARSRELDSKCAALAKQWTADLAAERSRAEVAIRASVNEARRAAAQDAADELRLVLADRDREQTAIAASLDLADDQAAAAVARARTQLMASASARSAMLERQLAAERATHARELAKLDRVVEQLTADARTERAKANAATAKEVLGARREEAGLARQRLERQQRVADAHTASAVEAARRECERQATRFLAEALESQAAKAAVRLNDQTDHMRECHALSLEAAEARVASRASRSAWKAVLSAMAGTAVRVQEHESPATAALRALPCGLQAPAGVGLESQLRPLATDEWDRIQLLEDRLQSVIRKLADSEKRAAKAAQDAERRQRDAEVMWQAKILGSQEEAARAAARLRAELEQAQSELVSLKARVPQDLSQAMEDARAEANERVEAEQESLRAAMDSERERIQVGADARLATELDRAASTLAEAVDEAVSRAHQVWEASVGDAVKGLSAGDRAATELLKRNERRFAEQLRSVQRERREAERRLSEDVRAHQRAAAKAQREVEAASEQGRKAGERAALELAREAAARHREELTTAENRVRAEWRDAMERTLRDAEAGFEARTREQAAMHRDAIERLGREAADVAEAARRDGEFQAQARAEHELAEVRKAADAARQQFLREQEELRSDHRRAIADAMETAAAEADSLRAELLRAEETQAQAAHRALQEQETLSAELASARKAAQEASAAAQATAGELQEAEAARAKSELCALSKLLDTARQKATSAEAQLALSQEELTRLRAASVELERGIEDQLRAAVESAERDATDKANLAVERIRRQLEDSQAALDAERERHAQELRDFELNSERSQELLLRKAAEQGRHDVAGREELERELLEQKQSSVAKLRADHQHQLRQLAEGHERALAAAREEAAKETEAAVRSCEDRAAKAAEARVKSVREEAERTYRSRLAALQAEVSSEMERTSRVVQEAQEEQAVLAAQETARSLAELRLKHQAQRDRLAVEHDTKLTDEREQWQRHLADLKAAHAAAVDTLEQRARSANATAESESSRAQETAVDAVRRAAAADAEAQQAAAELTLRQVQEAHQVEAISMRDSLARAEASVAVASHRHRGEVSALRLAAERAAMSAEDWLGVAMRISPQAVAARVSKALKEAEQALESGLRSAEAEMRKELDEKTAELQRRSAQQAELLASQRADWVAERTSLQQALEQARKAAHANEEESSRVSRSVQQRLEEVRSQGEATLAARVQAMEAEGAEDLSRQRKRLEKERDAAVTKAVTDARSEWLARQEQQVKQLRAAMETQLREVERQAADVQQAREASAAASHREQMQTALDRAMSEREASVEKLLREKADALHKLKEQHKTEVEELVQTFKATAARELEAARQRAQAEASAAAKAAAAEKAAALKAADQQAKAVLQASREEWQHETDVLLREQDEKMTQTVLEIQGEAAQLSDAHSQAMEAMLMREEDFRAGAIREHEAAVEAEVSRAMAEAEEEKAAAVSAFNAEWQAKLEGALDEAQARQRREAKTREDQFRLQLDEAEQGAAEARKAALEAFMQEAKEDQARLQRDKHSAVAAAVARTKDDAARALEAALASASASADKAVEAALDAADEDKRRAVSDARRQAGQEQEAAMEELREESERLLGSIESAMTKMRDERDLVESDLHDARAEISRLESQLDAQVQRTTQLLQSGRSMQLTMAWMVARHMKAVRLASVGAKEAASHAERQVTRLWQARVRAVERRLDAHRARASALLDMRAALHDTLTSHKRELLVEHKVKSTSCQNGLAELSEQRQEIQRQHRRMLQFVSETEGAVKAVEREASELSKQSVIQDGKVNVSLSRRKKRLDRDLDAHLAKLGDQRAALTDLEAQMAELEDARVEKEEELRFVEGQLVTTLVQQQRRLMTVLQSVKLGSDPDEAGVPDEGRVAKQGGTLRFADLLADSEGPEDLGHIKEIQQGTHGASSSPSPAFESGARRGESGAFGAAASQGLLQRESGAGDDATGSRSALAAPPVMPTGEPNNSWASGGTDGDDDDDDEGYDSGDGFVAEQHGRHGGQAQHAPTSLGNSGMFWGGGGSS